MSSDDLSWIDRIRAYRNRKVADPEFQRWALANPLARRFALKGARAAFDLCAGFVYSQILWSCVRLRLFENLKDGPQSMETLSSHMSLTPEATARLLDAAQSINLIERWSGGRYGLAPLGAAFAASPAALALIEHQDVIYSDLKNPVELLRRNGAGGSVADYWPYSAAQQPTQLSPEQVASYSALMTASQPAVAEQALDAYPIERHRALLDVGGGEGAFLMAAGERAPDLQLMLFDLPAVAQRAQARFEHAGLLERASVHSGDFLRDPLPQGADIISLVRIVHDHDDESALALLRNVRKALPKDGALLIIEAMSGVKGAESVAAYYDFYTLAMGRGQPRTFEQISSLLKRSGFLHARQLPTRLPLITSAVVAWPAI
jgi:demethylspheroidene O-methyltransferase